MARIRTIKPEFHSDEKIMSLSRDARLLFIGMWNFADDQGVLRDSAPEIKARIFPGDNDTNVPAWLEELVAAALVIKYGHDGRGYLHVVNLQKHQYIDKPRKSNLPQPPSNDFRGNPEKSFEILPGREGKGKEVCVEQKNLSTHTHTIFFDSEHFQITQVEFEALCLVNPELTPEQVTSEITKASHYAGDHPRRHKRRSNGLMVDHLKFLRDWLSRAEVGQARQPPGGKRPCGPADVNAEHIITPENVSSFAMADCKKCNGVGMRDEKIMGKSVRVRCECVRAPES